MGSDLKCDFDGRMPADFEGRLRFICGLMGWRVDHYWVRRTRNGYHTGVRLGRRITPWKAIAAQAVLGSDYRREAYNMGKWRKRHRAGTPEALFWNVTFTQKLTGRK